MSKEEKKLDEKLIEMGCKVWEKGAVKRIYIKSDTIKKLINFDSECAKNSYLEKNTKAIFQRIDSEGAYFCFKSNKIESKKVSVQDWFENDEFSSTFGY